jgi:hypothetical protein
LWQTRVVVVALTFWHDIEQLACTSAEEAEKWVSAFKHAKEEVIYELRI